MSAAVAAVAAPPVRAALAAAAVGLSAWSAGESFGPRARALVTALSVGFTVAVGEALSASGLPLARPALHGLLATAVVGAALIAFSTNVQRAAVFFHHAKNPFRDYKRVHEFLGPGVTTEHVSIRMGESHTVEGWLMAAPDDDAAAGSAAAAGGRVTRRRAQMTQSRPTILYCHGNGGDRGLGHRVELYKRLVTELRFRVLAIDYRGFADSPGDPSGDSAVADARAAFDWCAERFEPASVYLWGHSLGGGVATATAAGLECDGVAFGGLILEATFTSLADAMRDYPLAWVVYPWPALLDLVAANLKDEFDSVATVGKLQCRTLIMHATGDLIVPFSHGVKLSEAALARRPSARSSGDVVFTSFKDRGHCDIWAAPDLPETVRRFVQRENKA